MGIFQKVFILKVGKNGWVYISVAIFLARIGLTGVIAEVQTVI